MESISTFHFIICNWLPLANEVCEGNVFTGVCVSRGGIFQHALGRGCIPACIGQWGCESQHALDRGECLPRRVSAQGGVCLGGMSAQGGVYPVEFGQTPWDQRQTPQTRGRHPHSGYYGIRSTSGRYASPLECILGYHYFYRMVYLFNFCCAVLS